jgi:hypothetical protein
MFKSHHAGDVSGLEEVFRSQELSRMSESMGSGSRHTSVPSRGSDDAFLPRLFGLASSAVPVLHRSEDTTTEEGSQPADARHADPRPAMPPPRKTGTVTSGGGGALGEGGMAASDEPARKRQASRYWTIAALSGVVALVVAGVTAGTDEDAPSNRTAQGAHGTARSHAGLRPAAAPSATGPNAPGSFTGSVGSGALALGPPSVGASGSRTAPGGHVSLIGAATTTGTLPVSGGSPGGGGAGASPGSAGSNPVAPVGAGVGATVTTVGSTVTSLAGQLGTAVPTAAPVTSAVSGVLDTVDEVVNATPL